MIKEQQLNDTSLVRGLLKTLETKAKAASDKQAATEAPDTALDSCYVKENETLASWKACNKTRADDKSKMQSDCDAQQNAAVATYTIVDAEYKKGGAKPQAICNFEDYYGSGLEGTDAGCESFLEDITTKAKDAFDTQYSTYTAAANDCSNSKDKYDQTVLDCSGKRKTYTDQQALCITKDTDLKVKLCSFQTALKAKCSELKQVNNAIQDLQTQEESRNKELRTVSLSKCLFDQYANHDKTCFKPSPSGPTACAMRSCPATSTATARRRALGPTATPPPGRSRKRCVLER